MRPSARVRAPRVRVPSLQRPRADGRAAVVAALALAACVGALAGGCGAEEEEAPADCTAISDAVVTRLVPRLGGGHQVTARLVFADGQAKRGNRANCVRIGDDGGRLTTAAAARAATATATLLLIEPGGSPARNQTARALARAYVAARAADERIAVWRWGGVPTQVAALTGEARALFERLDAALPPLGTDERPAPASEALAAVTRALDNVGSVGHATLKSIVIVSPGSAPALPDPGEGFAGTHLVAWLGVGPDGDAAAAIPDGLRIVAAPDPAAPARTLARRLADHRAHAFVELGVCGGRPGTPVEAHVSTPNARAARALVLPPVLAENAPGRCRPRDLTAPPSFPRRVELLFTPEEREIAERIWTTSTQPGVIIAPIPPGRPRPEQPDPKERFTVSVKVTPAHAPVRAVAHFRGDSSYRCRRRSYSLNLEGDHPRLLFPGSANSEFHLVSMCLDRLYLRNATALALLAQEGLQPVPFDVVELVIDGQHQGLYLLFENVSEAIRQQTSRVNSILRRYKDFQGSGTFVDVRWARRDQHEAAVASYDAILGDTAELAGEAFERAVRGRLDLDQYFAWLAMMNVLGSGDYIDEVFFYAVESTGPDGRPIDHFKVMAWDQDDIFAACHFSGRYALVDPNGLVSCAEAEIDKRLLGDPHLYRRYTEVLAEVVARVTPKRFADALTAHAARLLDGMADRQVLTAMTEMARLSPGLPLDAEIARTLIQQEVDLLVAQFTEHRRRLQARLEALGRAR
jgi:hypothetical protein